MVKSKSVSPIWPPCVPSAFLLIGPFACRDDARLRSVNDDDNDRLCVCRGDHYIGIFQIYVSIPMDIDGFPPRSSEVDRGTSTKEEFISPFYSTAGDGPCKEHAKETRGNLTGLTAWSNFD